MSDRRKVTPNFYAMVLLLSCLNEVENVQAMSIALDMLFIDVEKKENGNVFLKGLFNITNEKEFEKQTKKLIVLSVKDSKPGNPLLLHFEPIYLENKIIGYTTSGNYSFNFNKNLSFGYIDAEFSNEELLNKNLYIEIGKTKYPALLESNSLKNKSVRFT